MKKVHCKIALFTIWLVIMLPVVEAQSMSFQEPSGDTTPPAISTVQLTHGPQTVVTWTTDEASNSKVEFGNTTALGQVVNKPDFETAHSLTLQTTPGTTYYHKITSCDATGNCKSASVDNFVAGPFYIQATIPRYAKSTKLDIPGSTRPGATVSVIVNGAEVRKDQIDDGEFFFKNIQLLKAANTIKLKSTLGAESAEANYQIDIDDQPPIINVTMPTVVITPSVTAKVKVSEPVNLTIELAKPKGDKPLRPTELKEEKTAANRVDISWKPISPILEYGVYRNDKKIATTTTTQYTDTTVGAGKQYKYQVSAVNDKCVESDLSDIVTVQTPTGTNTEQPTPEKLFSCEKAKQTLSFEGQKDIQVQLQEGENFVTFTAVDKAGYKSIAEERVLYDTGPPKFVNNNLKQLSPTYSQEITAKGQLSERGTVTAFVNGKAQKTEPTAEDGTFSIKIKLERTINYTAEQTRSSLDTGISWKSKVKLEAIDAAGLKTTTDEVQVEYALCGSGTWIDVKLTEPMPDILNPRLLIEGIQQLGIAFNYEYKGGAVGAVINPRDIRVKKLNLAPEFQKEYDNGIVTTYSPPVRAQRGKKPSGAGYIQINFQAIEDPWTLAEKDKDPKEKAPANATMYSKEERISNHRLGDCIAPGFGCMRLFLELEIPFQEETEQLGYLPEQKGGTIEQKKLTNRVQRTCINVNVAIDRRIPPDYIPSGLLRTISNALTTIIDTIDKVIKPIETIGKYLFYACVASTFLSFVPIFLEKYNCEYNKYVQMLSGEGAFKSEVAAIGACDEEYEGKDESKNNCKTCEKWKNNRKKFQRTYQQICDRVMCPAAPSLQYYLKTKGRSKTTKVDATKALPKLKDYTTETDGLQLGSDCAAWAKKRQTDAQAAAENEARPTGKPALRIPPSKFFTTQQIEDIYKDWLKHEPDTEETEGTTTGKVNCAGLHPATPECCGYEYMQEWSSACGVSALGSSLDTFDEIKESTCLAAQKANKNELSGLNPGEKTQCAGPGNLLNALSGFCTKDGQPTPETIPVVPFNGAAGEQPTGKLAELGLGTAKDRLMYLLMVPAETSKIPAVKNSNKEYDLKLGYIVETVEFDKSGKSKDINEDKKHYVTSKMEGVDLQEPSPGMQEKFFKQADLDKYYQNQLTPVFYTDFQGYLCEQAGYGKVACNAKARDIYKQVADKMGTPDKEYIIRPNEGLINSIRCLCFPTIIGYLKLWRKIMAEVRNCVNTILLTGDGESGVCQAIISKYVCDLLYEVLACFTQKFGSPGSGGTRTEGPGDIMGALTSAGTEMSRSVESRYGDSGMYKATFVDRKLVHSICMFAFTGTWNFDLGTIFDQAIDTIPIDSQALMYPCNRRFVAFNPSTRPPGLTTWVYHFGVFVAAGADIDVELHLVCSGGFHCKESDGFESGKCDCTAPKDVVILPQEIPTRIKKNDILSQEVFFTMTAGADESRIRYDKAYLKYTYKDGTKVVPGQTDTCSIGLTGGAGTVPAFCRFDILAQSFRCNFGEAEGALRFGVPTVVYPHKIPTEVYAVKDNLNVSLQIQQDYTAGEANIKHLQYEVLSPSGQVVETNKEHGFFPLSINGDYTKRIGQDPIIYVKKEWFGAGAGAGKANVVEWYSGTGARPARPVISVEPGSPQIVEQGVQTTGQYVLILAAEAGKLVYYVHKVTTPSQTPASGFNEEARICSGALPNPFETINCQDGTKTITIKLTDVRPQITPTGPSDRYEVYIGFGQIAGASPCEGADRLRPQPFKIRFTAFDSDKYGQPTEQVTLDPMTGQDGIVEVLLNIICANNDDADLKALKEKQAGILQPTEIIQGLESIMKEMLSREDGHKKQLTDFVSSPISDIGRANQIGGYMNTIIDAETKHAAQLEPLLKNLKSTTNPDLAKLTPVLESVYNRLRPLNLEEIQYLTTGQSPAAGPSPVELSVQANLNYWAGKIKDFISKETAPGTTPNIGLIGTTTQSDLRTLITKLDETMKAKQAVLDIIPQIIKVAPKPCPTGQIEQDVFYQCIDKAPGTPWALDETRPCYGVTEQKCYKLPKENNCAGFKGDLSFRCIPPNTQCSGKQVPVTSWEETISPTQKKTHNLVCPTAGQTCCREAITGTEKLSKLRDDIRIMLQNEKNYAKQLSDMKHVGYNEDLLRQMVRGSDGETPLTGKLQFIIGEETTAQNKLKSTIDTYTIGGDVKPPNEVNEIVFGKLLMFPVPFFGIVTIPIAGTPAVIAILTGIKNKLKELALETPPDPAKVRAKVDKATNALNDLNSLKTSAIKALNVQLKMENCPTGYDEGLAYGCFKFSCPSDSLWAEQKSEDGTMPACIAKEDKCCVASFYPQPPNILVGGKPLVPDLFITPGQQDITIKVPLLDQADLPDPGIYVNSEPVTLTKSFSNGVMTLNFKANVAEDSHIDFKAFVGKDQLAIPTGGWMHVECKAPSQCLATCDKDKGQSDVFMTCPKTEQEAGRSTCCRTLASLAQVPDDKKAAVKAYLDKYPKLEERPKEEQNRIKFCAYADAIPNFNYGQHVLGGSSGILWPEGSTLETVGKNRRAISMDYETDADWSNYPRDSKIDDNFHAVDKILYKNNQWVIEYPEAVKQHSDYYKIPTTLSAALSDASKDAGGDSQVVYFDNSVNGQLQVKVGSYCTFTMNTLNQKVRKDWANSEVNDNEAVTGGNVIHADEGPWYVYHKELINVLVPTAENTGVVKGEGIAPGGKIENFAFLSAGYCSGAYVEKGKFTDDNSGWGGDFVGLDVNAGSFLYLCVHQSVLDKYGANAIQLVPTTYCPTNSGYTIAGWFKNSYDNWGQHSKTQNMMSYDKIALCLAPQVKDIAYLGVQKTTLTSGGTSPLDSVTQYNCKENYIPRGLFTFRHGESEFAGDIYWPGSGWYVKYGSGSGNTAWLDGNSNNWVMLCAKQSVTLGDSGIS